MAEAALRIGWLGVGAMGLPMLTHLVRAGHAVTAFDTRTERLQRAQEAGAKPAADAASAARHSELLCTMVFDDAALEAAIDSVESALSPDGVVIDFSTVSPAASARVAQRLQCRELAFLRAPVSGSVVVAEAAQLSIFASGPSSAFARCRSVLATLSQTQRYLGEGEAARVVKLAINLLLVNHTALLGEALALGEAWGVTRGEMVDCINASVVGSRHTQARAEALATRQYGGAGPLQLGSKDLNLALSMAREKTLGLPISAFVQQYLVELLAEGSGDVEISKLAEFPRRRPHHDAEPNKDMK
jgi:3-hydroxyisobutyrate dehydrogenase